MYKNQLQELAQRSCFNLPSYSCIREGPDHAPRFKATVNFNGETFESPTFCFTLRQAEHAAAEIALNTLANRGPSKALAARVLDETGVYKNLLQETAHRAGLNLPVYTTVRSGPGHVPSFSCRVDLGGMSFTGELARSKKQAQKNAAMAAWSTLRKLSQHGSSSSSSPSSPSLESKGKEEQEQVVIARFLSSLRSSQARQSMQIDCQYEKQRSIPVCQDLTSPTPSLYSMQGQSWAYPSFSPEMAMPIYHIWQQEQLLQLQNRLFSFPVSPVPSTGPHIVPYMQSILRPDHHLSFQARDLEPIPTAPGLAIATSSCPSHYSSNHSTSQPTMGRSTVTIQEIHEEIKDESSKYSQPVVIDPPVPGQTNAELGLEESKQEDHKQKNVELDSKGENVHRMLDTGSRPVNYQLEDPHAFESTSHLRPRYPPRSSSYRNPRPPSSVAGSVMIRTVSPVSSVRPPAQKPTTQVPVPPRMRTGAPFSTRPRFERTNLGGMHPSSMAPPVRIRSVVPVCSAPPPRKTPSFNHEGVLPNKEKKDAVPEDVSTPTSELNKLSM
ncbi:double-stranded RNA-binding protein 2-like [Durio zibethinus]|uniref:Double-stranded RNA-binding protein 2-like n=1 Tax=Durio zibethinus TaxID=66656 RepID=A0A6P5WT58_DURZI|nr:double-stranded RNA-binding protein 2-like [Durio zibethinus]XP_022719248.1 double-stranded RNA-binding protein 2-like [Durio zibethinus]XP_022719249.1 double-stranded RNA-binding protein 2-like [Durio zibethinus]